VQVAKEDGRHKTLAKLFHGMFPDRFAYLGKVDGWYSFQAPRWSHIRGDVEDIITIFNNEFSARIQQYIDAFSAEERPDKDLIKTLDAILNRKMTNTVFVDHVIKALQTSYKVAELPSVWLSKLDSNMYLLGFDDMVYDFHERRFRCGTPDDMISMTVGHTAADIIECDPVILDEIKMVLGSMHEQVVLDFLLRFLATSVVGDRRLDCFQVWSGTGANGKGLIKLLACMAFGDYAYEPDQTLFSSRSVSGSCLSSELALMKGKRLIITSEAEASKDNKLRVGLLKKCTGHDKIQARDLYASAATFKPTANIVMCFNEIPGMEDSSDGTARRFNLIQFLKKAVHNPTNPNHIKRDDSLPGKFDSKAYGACFLAWLIEIYLRHGFAFETPECVKLASTEYIGENDVLGQFLSDEYDITNVDTDKVPLSDVWDALRESRTYFNQMDLRMSRELSQKLKNKGFRVGLIRGKTYVRGIKPKDGSLMPVPAPEDEDEDV
jgi:P4 family phage/plasmid primase-like protien